MQPNFSLYSLLAPSLALLLSCGSNSPATGEQSDATPSVTDAVASTPDADECTGGTLCGQPASCCPSGNECIENACLTTCESGVRCGQNSETCCGASEVCISDSCAAPGANCLDSYDCQPGQFCEPTLGQCLPQPDPLTCQQVPVFDNLDVQVEWSYEAEEIISIPVVADVDNDGSPEVIVNLTRQDGGSWPSGKILILSGESGAIQVGPIPHDPGNNSYGSHGRSTIAVGDVSGDGVPDIIYPSRDAAGSLIVAIDGSGNFLWKSHTAGGADFRLTVENAAITLTNFDNDPEAEIVIGGTILDHNGLVVHDAGNGAQFGTNGTYFGGISAVAELDGDDSPEIVSGRNTWKVNWIPGATPADVPSVTVTPYWTADGNDGYPAVADVNGDGIPEVILVSSSSVRILNGQTGQLFCTIDPTDVMCLANSALRTQPIALPGGGIGGPPTISDFDADGRVEIGIAGAGSYTVYDLNRTGENIVQPMGAPAPIAGALYARWSNTTQDNSSNATGSSVFDFQGDGAAEVVYADECYMRVYSGSDGTEQLVIPNSNATIHEYPLVVDVDGDGNSEILVVATDQTGCNDAGYVQRKGLFVYGDVNDEWVPTRRVWTQHTYHVSNADSSGNVPMSELDNWLQPGLNNYRQNVQGDGVFNAPDLTLSISVGINLCNNGQYELQARVTNIGALGVPPGAIVTFYEGTSPAGTNLGTAATTQALLPGGSTLVTLVVTAPPNDTDYFAEVDGTAVVTVAECDTGNNGAQVTQVGCIVVD